LVEGLEEIVFRLRERGREERGGVSRKKYLGFFGMADNKY